MISNERLEEFAYDKRMCNVTEEIVSMARELLALRKAFSEPVAWRHDDGPFGNVVTSHKKVAESWNRSGFKLTPLYEKPPTE